MSCVIRTNDYDNAVLAKLERDLSKRIEPPGQKYTANLKVMRAYIVDEKDPDRPCNVPFNYGLKSSLKYNIVTKRPNRKITESFHHVFEGELRHEQKACRTQMIAFLQEHKSVILACYTGFGKTVTALNVASKIKLKTLITVPKKPLMAQWSAEINKFIPNATVLVVDAKMAKSVNSVDVPDFAIVNACNIHKICPNFLKKYGLVIVDEAHLQMTETLCHNLLKLTPRYLIGVTATPYREDGYDFLFNMFFGDSKVTISLNKKHVVYKVKTGFRPNNGKILKLGPQYKTKLDWNALLDEQAKNVERNDLIVKIVEHFKARTFLILVKRVEHGKLLMDRLIADGESVTSLLGKQQQFDPDARILIGTNSKIGTGFNHPKLDTLLCACDMVSYYIQFVGRIMRRTDVEPVVFDLVDSHPILKKHFQKRLKVYVKHGGQVSIMETNFI